jgi:hypothetical protein
MTCARVLGLRSLLPWGVMMVILPSTSMAGGWLEERVRKVVTATGDVLSLGATARERDRLEAEREEAAARQRRDAAEKLRQAQIQEISRQVARQDAVLTGQVASLSLSVRLVQLQKAVLLHATKILDERDASLSVVEFVKDLARESTTGEANALSEAVVLKPPTQREIEQADSAGGIGASKLASLEAFVKAHDTKNMISSSYLNEAVSKLKTGTVRELIRHTTEAHRIALELRQRLYNELLESKTERESNAQRLAALGVTVAETPESVVVAVKQFAPVVKKAVGPADAPERTASELDAIDTSLDAAFEAQTTALPASSDVSGRTQGRTAVASAANAACHQAFQGITLKSIRVPCAGT